MTEQLRQWAVAGQKAPSSKKPEITPIAAPRGDLALFLAASYPSGRLVDVILPTRIEDELAYIVVETRMLEKLEEKGLKPRRRVLLSGPPGTGRASRCLSRGNRTNGNQVDGLFIINSTLITPENAKQFDYPNTPF